MRARKMVAAMTAAIGIASLAACSDPAPATSGYTGAIGPVNLREVCPAKIVVQAGWNPEAEFGFLFDLITKQPRIDADHKTTSGPLFSHGEYTGVDMEIRAGGPAIGFQPVTSRMYQDQDILLGNLDTEQAIVSSATAPVTSVLAPMAKSPQMIMWDPKTYPQVHTIADLKATHVKGAVPAG
ncbi:hypothetical protein [Nocardia sp. alder85J]|uniref:hypothetical protein n=1 Tax=Nocardia sp. alder85J TaxID=2862949 RepID=UPI001CD42A2A|nr:hypothetical protein [Nocardia sp. alder85J]MCX4098171.1 hypothetical protein [Nocardia sp. alder85J]